MRTRPFNPLDACRTVIWAEDPDGRLYRYKEIYRTKTRVDQHAEVIKRVTANEPKPKVIVCDHDAEGRATLERHLGMSTVPAHKAVQDGLDGHSPRQQQLEDFARRTLAKYGKTRLEDLPVNFNGLVMLESERLAGEVFDHHFGRLWDRLESQDRVVTWAGVAAPLLGLRAASMALAGTDFTHHRHFAVAAEQHRRAFVRVLNEEMLKPGGGHGSVAGRELWEKLPAFRYDPPPLAYALRAATPGLVVLGLWVAGAWAALLYVAPRLKPN